MQHPLRFYPYFYHCCEIIEFVPTFITALNLNVGKNNLRFDYIGSYQQNVELTVVQDRAYADPQQQNLKAC